MQRKGRRQCDANKICNFFLSIKKDEVLLFVGRKDAAGNIPKKLMKATFESRVIRGLSHLKIYRYVYTCI